MEGAFFYSFLQLIVFRFFTLLLTIILKYLDASSHLWCLLAKNQACSLDFSSNRICFCRFYYSYYCKKSMCFPHKKGIKAFAFALLLYLFLIQIFYILIGSILRWASRWMFLRLLLLIHLLDNERINTFLKKQWD